MTIQQILKTKSPKVSQLELEVLLSHILNIPKTQVISSPEIKLNKQQILKLNRAILNLENNTPLSYITHKKEFYGIEFHVNKNTLIPRPETEVLVEHVINSIEDNSSYNILDIGTGSGCIPISIAFNSINCFIDAIDIEKRILKVVEKNINSILNQEQKKHINLVCSKIENFKPTKKYNIIISNPPYVPITDYKKLEQNIFKEPFKAITDGADGLYFYKIFNDFVYKNLDRNGYAIFEIDSKNLNAIVDIFKSNYNISILKDYSNKSRFVIISFR